MWQHRLNVEDHPDASTGEALRMAIWQELVDTCGFAADYKSVNRFVGKLRGRTPTR